MFGEQFSGDARVDIEVPDAVNGLNFMIGAFLSWGVFPRIGRTCDNLRP